MADDQRLSAETRAEPIRFSANEFQMLIASGIAAKLGRIELRGGTIYRKNAQYAPHMRMKIALMFALKAEAGRAVLPLEVGSEGTVDFADFMPLPDVFLYAATSARAAIPGEQVALVIEVSDSTVADDMGDKRDRYAAAGLAEYWVVDMGAGAIMQMAAPVDGVFTLSQIVRRGNPADALTLAGLQIETADLPWGLA